MLSGKQSSLFELQPNCAVRGLTYVADAVSAGDERKLADLAGGLYLVPFAWRGFTGNRRAASFGYRYDFSGGGFQRADPLPAALIEARALAARAVGRSGDEFEQCSVIEYAPGAGIGWHKDRPHFGDVMGLSLLAPCRFRFKRETGEGRVERQALLLQPASVYLMEGEARHAWRHSIPPMHELRYSLTFRTLAP